MEIIESKEKRQSENDAVHQLRAEMGLLKEETSATIAQLGETVRKLTQDNESLREELRKMSDTNLLSTREQQNNPPLNQTTDIGSQTETSNQAETKNNRTDPSPLPPHTSLPPTQPTKEQRIEPSLCPHSPQKSRAPHHAKRPLRLPSSWTPMVNSSIIGNCSPDTELVCSGALILTAH